MSAVHEKAFAAEKHVAVVRLLVIAFNVAVFVFWLDHAQTIVPLAYAVSVVAAAYAVIVLAYQPYRRFPVLRSAWFTAITDATLITLWLYATGGFESPFYVLWYISLAAVGFRFSARTTGLIAGVYAFLYIALLESIGEFTPHLVAVAIRVAYIFLIALLVGYQAQETYEQTRGKVQMRQLMLETKRAEQKLRESEQEIRRNLSLLRATLDSTADGILVVDTKNRITSFNQRFVDMWRIPMSVMEHGDDDLAIRYVLDQLQDPKSFVAKVRELYAQVSATSFDILEFKDGRVFERYSRPQVLEGVPVGRVWSFRDVTERRKAEQDNLKNLERAKEIERLRELDRFKTQFVNSVAHELWTPLTPIKLQLHMLQTNRADGLSDDQKRSIGVIDRNMDRLSRLVEELLDGARLQAGRFRVQRTPMNLHTVVSEMVELFRIPAEAAGVRLEAALDRNLPIEGDANRLVQVMYNLMSNALKFTPRGGTIRVRARPDADMARVSVEDTGAGLTTEQRSRLFQAFSQVHDTMQQTRAGTGLGLYISRAIVEAHNGLLGAHSDGPGQGSAFEFTIPLRRPADDAATVDEVAAPA